MTLTLITGGARSGKSTFAEEMAKKSAGSVLFVATATASDTEMAERIKKHRAGRPGTWVTLETSSNIGAVIEGEIANYETIVIDCLTLLANNVFCRHLDASGELTDPERAEADCYSEINALLAVVRKSNARFIIVTNEVGEGIVPANRISRIYRDVLGKLNQKVAKEADTVYLMVAGIPLKVK